MKRNLLVVAGLLIVFMLSASTVKAGGSYGYLGKKVFSIEGEFVEYVPFSFMVPTGCGNIKTFEFIPSYGGSTPARWEELVPGSYTPSWGGIYKFQVDGTNCEAEFSIEGEVPYEKVNEVWSGMEQNPEDLGVLVQGDGLAKNFFDLSSNDVSFSYVIVYPRYGQKITLDSLVDFVKRDVGIKPSDSKLVGIITSDSRGFLTKKLGLNQAKKTLAKDELVVLIFRHL